MLLEAANFEMYAIRHTMQTLKLPTDAAVRFERGLDPNLAWPAAERATALILELCPGARVVATADVYPHARSPNARSTCPTARSSACSA